MSPKPPTLRKILIGSGLVIGTLALGAVLVWWRLQPYEREVNEVSGIAPPHQLSDHCRDSIGEPRIESLADGVYAAVGFDLANTIVITTRAGNIVIDAGMSPARAMEARAAMEAHAPGRTAAIIYTHSHIDHVGGASAWADADTQVWATETFREHFLKQYSVFRKIETRRAARQFGAHVDEDSLPCSALGRRVDLEAAMKTGVVMPTHTFTDRHELIVGDTRIELVEAPGETHDQLFVFAPDQGVLMPGDNYYRAFPNLYTIRGTTPRPVDDWITSIDAMRRRAPRVLAPSHTVPIRGAAEVQAALTRYRDGIQWVRDRVVHGANRGMDVDEIAESIGLPERLAGDAALAPLYGQLDWSARAIYSNHLGWFDGRPEALYPMANGERSRRTLALMGGTARAWQEIERPDADPQWSLSLLRLLEEEGSTPTSKGSRWATAKADALEKLATTIGNSNGRGYLLESAHELRHGRSEPRKPTPPDELLDSIPIASFFRVMASRLIPERSIDTHESVAFRFTDTDERFVVTIRWGVAEIVAGDPLPGTPEPVATVTTRTGTWRRLAIDALNPASALAEGDLDVDGEVTRFYTFSKRFERGI